MRDLGIRTTLRHEPFTLKTVLDGHLVATTAHPMRRGWSAADERPAPSAAEVLRDLDGAMEEAAGCGAWPSACSPTRKG